MKQSIKISVMALVAMFAFSTVADAQFGLGGLVKSAKKALKKEKKTEIVLPGATEPVKVKGEMKVYEENAPLGKDMVRTIFMLGDQKMMLDQPVGRHSTGSNIYENSILDPANKVNYKDYYFISSWKDAAFIERVKVEFEKQHEGRTPYRFLNYRGSGQDGKWKVGNIGTDATGWQYNRDKWGNITYRYFKVYILFELEDGQNIVAPFEVCENNAGGSNYDEDTLLFNFAGWGAERRNFWIRSVYCWEVKTDCYTSTLASK